MWLSGRASPCQGEGRGFESRHPLGTSGPGRETRARAVEWPRGEATACQKSRLHGFRSRLHLVSSAEHERGGGSGRQTGTGDWRSGSALPDTEGHWFDPSIAHRTENPRQPSGTWVLPFPRTTRVGLCAAHPATSARSRSASAPRTRTATPSRAAAPPLAVGASAGVAVAGAAASPSHPRRGARSSSIRTTVATTLPPRGAARAARPRQGRAAAPAGDRAVPRVRNSAATSSGSQGAELGRPPLDDRQHRGDEQQHRAEQADLDQEAARRRRPGQWRRGSRRASHRHTSCRRGAGIAPTRAVVRGAPRSAAPGVTPARQLSLRKLLSLAPSSPVSSSYRQNWT